MIMAPQCTSLPDGRLHFSHGPIDLLIQADGKTDAIQAAHERAWRRFETILPELVSELPALQRPVDDACDAAGAVAQRMWRACHPFRHGFITSMAAVAGSVADEIAGCYAHPGIDRAAVNNGGDIALYLSAGASYRVGICTDIVTSTENAKRGKLQADGDMLIEAHMPVRGIATSGWRGRSFSLGIADSVTVLAGTASQADAAATVIANAVNVDDPRVKRVPACDLKDNTDLGNIPVTTDVPRLESGLIDDALRAGLEQARRLQSAGLIFDAVLACQGHIVRVQEDVCQILQSHRYLAISPAGFAGRPPAVGV
jgi:ApbE superfamily uncharacterized protein (UPF0280 family)